MSNNKYTLNKELAKYPNFYCYVLKDEDKLEYKSDTFLDYCFQWFIGLLISVIVAIWLYAMITTASVKICEWL